ncbi:hypothetical protein ColLi_06995 [Colletotrichum liriopes]|uniref:Uncharacterized protein n=1 Tax=Colletotrichum liriopes TaxID=708192 RepID=A0AA37GNQ7_9PEZI|nr:hypothetical protein ColLi_06995 [Colletotrichum liriopes]
MTMYPIWPYASPAVGRRCRVHCALAGFRPVQTLISNISLVKHDDAQLSLLGRGCELAPREGLAQPELQPGRLILLCPCFSTL